MTAKRFRRRPGEIEAMQWTGGNLAALIEWTGGLVDLTTLGLDLFVNANDAWLTLDEGEWIAKDRHGFYPIKADVFAESYEEIT